MSDAKIIWLVCCLGGAALVGGVIWALESAGGTPVGAITAQPIPASMPPAGSPDAAELADLRTRERNQESTIADLLAKLDAANAQNQALQQKFNDDESAIAAMKLAAAESAPPAASPPTTTPDVAPGMAFPEVTDVSKPHGSCGHGYTFSNVRFVPLGEHVKFVGEVNNYSGASPKLASLKLTAYGADGAILDDGIAIVQNFDDGSNRTFDGILLHCPPGSVASFKVEFDQILPGDNGN
jgi:hypothetical protein